MAPVPDVFGLWRLSRITLRARDAASSACGGDRGAVASQAQGPKGSVCVPIDLLRGNTTCRS